MNHNQELLQRCFDNDLTDGEMELLFREMSFNIELRREYKEMSLLRDNVREAFILNQQVLDESFSYSNKMAEYVGNKSPIRRLFSKKVKISLPVLAAIFLLTVFSSMYVIKQLTPPQQTEYVYMMEMPPYVVQDFSNIHSN